MASQGMDPYTGVYVVIDDGELGGSRIDAALHVDADVICPRCLNWIGPLDYVRRTFTDVLEHESCPRPLPPGVPSRRVGTRR